MLKSAAILAVLAVATAVPDRYASATARTKAAPRAAKGATYVSGRWPLPVLEVQAEGAPTETLAQALESAYQTNPSLQANRYELRSADEDFAQALSELRPTTQIQIDAGYLRQVPDEQGGIFGSSPSIIHSNSLNGSLSIEQPVYTGGKATADADAAAGAIRAGRAGLRAAEGDLFLRVIGAYVDVRRDVSVLALRSANLRQLQATLDEVIARREAGELTRTDIAQADTQLQAARAQTNAAEQQLEQDRSAYAELVGHDPKVLAPGPELPELPSSVDAAFRLAERINPDLGQAIETERASRARIAAAKSEGRPTLSVRSGASFDGAADPFRFRRDNRDITAQVVLTVPLTNGGRVRSLVAQALDRNDADRIRIEQSRRAVVRSLVDAWNALATAQRNVDVQTAQLQSARVLDEGTFEEYRAGLRSTFDVLFAHGSLRDAQIALVGSQHDLYLAHAALLRAIGVLDARTVLTGTALYNPDENTRHGARRGSVPWESIVQSIDRSGRPTTAQDVIEQPRHSGIAPRIIAGPTVPGLPMVRSSPSVPLPGTVGVPKSSERGAGLP
jgi:outer membrane protein